MGTTDTTGLFVAIDGALAGKQTVLAIATGYRAEQWVGVNGANVTVPVRPLPVPSLPQANVSGSIPSFTSIPVVHERVGYVGYSLSDPESDANNLQTAGYANFCQAPPSSGCNYTVTSRTGPVTLIAAIYDVDMMGTSSPYDDVYSVVTWAFKTDVTVVNGVAQSSVALTIIPTSSLPPSATIAFGTPPAGLTRVYGQVGVELGDEGVGLLNYASPSSPTILLPPLTLFTSERLTNPTYRLTSTARDSNGTSSTVIHRGLTTASFAAGTWLAPASSIVPSGTTSTWMMDPSTIISTFLLQDVIEVMVFDGSMVATIPTSVTLPTSAIPGVVGSMAGTLDVTSFGFIADTDKITATAKTSFSIN